MARAFSHVMAARAVGRHALPEPAKQESLRRVPASRGLNHVSQLLNRLSEHHNTWRGHSTIGDTIPSLIHRGRLGSDLTDRQRSSRVQSSDDSSRTRESRRSGWGRGVRPASEAPDRDNRFQSHRTTTHSDTLNEQGIC